MTERNQPQAHAASPDTDASKGRRSVAPRTIRGRVVAGLFLLIPVMVTAVIIKYIYGIALSSGARLLNLCTIALNWAFKLDLADRTFNPNDATWYESLIAVVMTIVVLYMFGWLGTNAVGRRIFEFIEGMVERIPMVETLYVAVKRIVQALTGSNKPEGENQTVVLIDFPTDTMKALAFMTNVVTDRTTGQQYATVFVPTTPNPTSGYMELVPIERVTQTDLSMEAALSMILSGGASAPPTIGLIRGIPPKPAVVPPPGLAVNEA